MVFDLKFCKFDDTPWGFRLVGGADYKIPLTVSRVMEDGLAEEAGLKSGDVIVRINDTPTINLTHNEAHDLLKKTGNNFMLGILRDVIDEQFNDEYSPIQTPDMFNGDLAYIENQIIQSPMYTPSPAEILLENHCESNCVSNSYNMTSANMNTSVCEFNEISEDCSDVTDDQIAEIISGEAEVLKEHNVLGVNFQKIIPQSGMIKGSDVFKQLNAEAIQTKEEKEKEDRKWTTFLQKPNRPIPKTKKQIVEEAKNQPYRVNIVKQPKPRVAPDRIPTPDVPEPVPQPVIELIPEPEPQYVEYLNEDQNQGESPMLEEAELNTAEIEDQVITETGNKSEQFEINTTEETAVTESVAVVNKTPEELLLEQQLLDIQKQLLALSTLPTAIQSTLDAITSQLSKIVPAMMTQKAEPTPRPISSSTCEEAHTEDMLTDVSICGDSRRESRNDDIQLDEVVNEAAEDADSEREDDDEDGDKAMDSNEQENNTEGEDIEVQPPKLSEEEIALMRQEEMLKARETEWMNTRHREEEELEAEHQQRLISQRITPHPPPKPKISVFGPLVPQERPIFLPGGRRWRCPKDAFNEEFIAEIISSQAELITGTTLGSTYESPFLGYDNRESNCHLNNRKLQKVNFLKYQKPEKDLSNLKNSEVFKMVHNLDKKPRHGIETRPEKVIAEQDARPIAC